MCLFNSPSPQASPTPPPPIVNTTDTTNAAYVSASQTAQQKAALASGQGSTIMTGGMGVPAGSTPTQQKSLLGE